MSDDLIEKALSAFCRVERGQGAAAFVPEIARAAVAIVLEEAARVAESFPAHTHGALNVDPPVAARQAAREIAAAIRAMIPER